MIIEELANEGGDATAAFRLLLDGSRLLGRESKGLREVIVSRRGLGHRGSFLYGVTITAQLGLN
jgi:hypothetical protein